MSSEYWYGLPAWQLEDEHWRVLIVPSLGAKIASLVDKVADQEWLARPSRRPRLPSYGDTFTDYDLGGWDEMFPTINACPAPHNPAITWPDHGEVWALPWEVLAQDARSLRLAVRGRQADYVLERRASLREGALRLDYRLENRGAVALPFLWAAHPLFHAEAGTRLELPAEVIEVVNAAQHPRWGAPDTRLDWPEAQGQRLDVVRPPEADYRKVYAPPEQPCAWSVLWRGTRGLHLHWDESFAPYLGVWIDEGLHTRESTAAFEPASAFYDSLSEAAARGLAPHLLPAGVAEWWLEVRLA
jgi:galactose mutarotase-like enzyme